MDRISMLVGVTLAYRNNPKMNPALEYAEDHLGMSTEQAARWWLENHELVQEAANAVDGLVEDWFKGRLETY